MSDVRPAIRSVLILSKPASLAALNASSVCFEVCLRPMFSSTLSLKVCGFMLRRVMPAAFNAASFSAVTVSGRPASTVYSLKWDRSKFFSITAQIFSICSAERVVGVPPPQYIDSSLKFSFFAFCAVYSSSVQRFSTYSGISLPACSIECETNEQ